MPNLPLPDEDYLGSPDRTTGEFQAQINDLQNWVRALQAELTSLSTTTLGEGAVRGVGSSTGQVPDKAVLDARLGTTGILGTAAQVDTGTSAGNVPLNSDLGSAASIDYEQTTAELGGSFGVQDVILTRIGSVVFLTTNSLLTHGSSDSPTSTAGAIPLSFRPTAIVRNVTDVSTAGGIVDREFYLNSSGTFGAIYSQNTTSSGSSISLVYTI